MLFKKLTVSIIVFLLIILNVTSLFAYNVYLGGQSAGIVLDYQGVLITGGYNITIDNQSYNPLDNDFQAMDLITKVNDQTVDNIESLTKVFKDEKDQYQLTIVRQQDVLEKTLKIQRDGQDYSSGLYVKDALSGIGTVTYYTQDGHFASLGHEMNDGFTSLDTGEIYESSIDSIKKSSQSEVGQKNGTISNVQIGTIYTNNQYGIYGDYHGNIDNLSLVETANQDEVVLGEAYFLTVLDNQTVQKCKITITELKKQDKSNEKGITFRLDDQEVIKKTNGIIQGMSGSPIIQNNKLVGCVTHASSKDHLYGYGMYIDWMINNTEKST